MPTFAGFAGIIGLTAHRQNGSTFSLVSKAEYR
jgi:hypothetical protein